MAVECNTTVTDNCMEERNTVECSRLEMRKAVECNKKAKSKLNPVMVCSN